MDPAERKDWLDGLAEAVKEDREPELPENDPVNHPAHYTSGKIECIDYITDKQLDFCLGNAVKYITRAGHKDPEKTIEDLEKAVFYINYKIKILKEEQTNEEAEA